MKLELTCKTYIHKCLMKGQVHIWWLQHIVSNVLFSMLRLYIHSSSGCLTSAIFICYFFGRYFPLGWEFRVCIEFYYHSSDWFSFFVVINGYFKFFTGFCAFLQSPRLGPVIQLFNMSRGFWEALQGMMGS